VQLVDEFTAALSEIESKLESPPALEINNINQMKLEMDVVSVNKANLSNSIKL
jgi:hypothetical protein